MSSFIVELYLYDFVWCSDCLLCSSSIPWLSQRLKKCKVIFPGSWTLVFKQCIHNQFCRDATPSCPSWQRFNLPIVYRHGDWAASWTKIKIVLRPELAAWFVCWGSRQEKNCNLESNSIFFLNKTAHWYWKTFEHLYVLSQCFCSWSTNPTHYLKHLKFIYYFFFFNGFPCLHG